MIFIYFRIFDILQVEMLQGRLDELKKRNEEERMKMQEKLSFEAWKKNSPELREV